MSRLLRHLTIAGLLALVPLSACGDDGTSGAGVDPASVVGTAAPTTPTPTPFSGPLPAWIKDASKLCKRYRRASLKVAKPYQQATLKHPGLMYRIAKKTQPKAEQLVADLRAVDAPPRERWLQFVGNIETSFQYSYANAKAMHTRIPLSEPERTKFSNAILAADQFLEKYPIAACRPPM